MGRRGRRQQQEGEEEVGGLGGGTAAGDPAVAVGAAAVAAAADPAPPLVAIRRWVWPPVGAGSLTVVLGWLRRQLRIAVAESGRNRTINHWLFSEDKKCYLNKLPDEVLRYLLLVPFGDVLDDDLGFIDPAVAQQPARALGDNPPVAADREKE